jgi:hypothetical protein
MYVVIICKVVLVVSTFAHNLVDVLRQQLRDSEVGIPETVLETLQNISQIPNQSECMYRISYVSWIRSYCMFTMTCLRA